MVRPQAKAKAAAEQRGPPDRGGVA
jgi:hypothetical protein